MSNEYLQNNLLNINEFNKKKWQGGNVTGTIKQYITSITDEDAVKFEIQKGKLVYIVPNGPEKNWVTDLGISLGTPLSSYAEVGLNVIATDYATFDGKNATFNNPIIPKGFKAINTTTTWPEGWNEGLVIEDESGNQFVWVPIDGIDVIYVKDFTYPSWGNRTAANTSDDILPSGIAELDQITKYSGFYIARYEAMFDYNGGNIRVASKKSLNKTNLNWSTTRDITHSGYVWNYINNIDAKLYAENMASGYGYDEQKVITHLITGTQWDATMKWLSNSGKNVSDSGLWGNYYNSQSPANVSGYGSLQISGYSEEWKAKNIYDLAGNEAEIINEKYNNNNIIRSGSNINSSASFPASCRSDMNVGSVMSSTSFRIVLNLL